MTDNKTDWVKAVHPELDVMWIEEYLVQFDGLIAIPVFSDSEPAKKALERGIIRRVSPEQAQQINERFAAEGWREYLESTLAHRWSLMKIKAAERP